MTNRFTIALVAAALLAAWAAQSAAAPLNLLGDPGFEGPNPSAWTAFDSCRVEVTAAAAHGGSRSLAVHAARDGAGVRTDVASALQPGYNESFTAWFRSTVPGTVAVDLSLVYRQRGVQLRQTIGRIYFNEGEWAEFSGHFVVPDSAEATGLSLAIEAAAGAREFCVDDLELRPALQLRRQRSSGIEARLGPASPEREATLVRMSFVDPLGRQVAQADQHLDAPFAPALAEGFYRVVASVQDVDGRRFDEEMPWYVGEITRLASRVVDESNALAASAALEKYRGVIRYLQYRASHSRERDGADADPTLTALTHLARWAQTIRANPAALDTLSGVREWAYCSRADDSGQPFRLAIPPGYDAAKRYPLVVVLHGYGGNHLDYVSDVQQHADYFELGVLGRGRGCGYSGLAEADVLDAVAYVCAHWSIDERRIHLTGNSMGGGGTFRLGTRHPDLWASARPVCGYGLAQPMENALNLPFYATHSLDDPAVPVLASRAPLQKLRAVGGQVVIDETNGLGHASWAYTAGNDRARAWALSQVRPESRMVRRIDYTATDAMACGAYWLQVAEWGDLPGPARFKATAGEHNDLYLDLTNVRTLRLATAQSPFDVKQDLRVSVGGGPFVTVHAPLPDTLFLMREAGGWAAGAQWTGRPALRPRTPGGVNDLYDGEPLLIVYGTCGDEPTRRALSRAAAAASKSPMPLWVDDGGDSRDGVPNHQMLYGRLRTAPDTAVTDADLKRCHLMLIGTADENTLVRRMQNRLPVRFGREIVCSDGQRLPAEGAVMGLHFYDPLAPGRLVYWVAADRPASYHVYPALLVLQSSSPCGQDLLVVREDPIRVVSVRRFDSRWQWVRRDGSASIAEADNTVGRVFERIGRALRMATGSDLALMALPAPSEQAAGVAGLTRWEDLASLDVTQRVARTKMTGEMVLRLRAQIASNGEPLRLYGDGGETIVPARTYVVAVAADADLAQYLIRLENQVPDTFEILDVTLFEAMERFLF